MKPDSNQFITLTDDLNMARAGHADSMEAKEACSVWVDVQCEPDVVFLRGACDADVHDAYFHASCARGEAVLEVCWACCCALPSSTSGHCLGRVDGSLHC